MQEFAAPRLDPAERLQKIRRAGDDGGGQIAVGNERAGAVDIGQDSFEKPCALRNAGGDLLPFRRFDQQRQMAERPGAFARIAIGAIGDAGIANVPVGGREATVDVVRAEAAQGFEKADPMRPLLAGAIDEFIRNIRQWPIIRRQRDKALGGDFGRGGGFRRAHLA